MDNHLGNNERFSILPGQSQKFSPLAPPPPRRQVPGRAHLVVAGNKEKQRKASSLETRTGKKIQVGYPVDTPIRINLAKSRDTID